MITPEGDYLSNLTAPDLRPYFKHLHWRKMGHSMGHLVASDWADKAVDDPVFGLYKNCGLWTRDEAAILWTCAEEARIEGSWLDIGCHTGWTTFQLRSASYDYVDAVDPMLGTVQDPETFGPRFWGNVSTLSGCITAYAETSNEFFAKRLPDLPYTGVVIDGDHEPGKPLEDTKNAVRHLTDPGVIIFHDFIGAPVREAVTWLMDQGFKARVYWTPHMVACCWRGDFTPPDHVGDPRINWTPHLHQMKKDFDFGRLS